MAKRLSDNQKKIIVKCFIQGKTVDDLAEEFQYAKTTIIRNLKRSIGDEKYKKLIDESKSEYKSNNFDKENNSFEQNNVIHAKTTNTYKTDDSINEDFSQISPFTEITPLNFEIENSLQKDLSSVPIEEVNLPTIVYMIIAKEFELEVKYLKDFPDWQFLSKDELNRKTIEIYLDSKIAKRFCKKEQKVIKVPNSNVFRIVAPILQSRGITRIVSADQLIAL